MFKSGYVAVVGKTNVGKSSIINSLIGENFLATSNKVQTTRKNVKGIYNDENCQIIFLDTPGINKSKSELAKIMRYDAYNSLKDCDIILYVIDASDSLSFEEVTFERIKQANKDVILVINKIDLINKEKLAKIIEKMSSLYDFKAIIPTSVNKDKNVKEIINELLKLLPEGPKYYSDDEYTDESLRDIVSETIREKALKLLRDEVPHGIYVETTKMKKRKTKNDEPIYDIESTIYCLRESHKGIIIGKNGQMLKRIGSYAREDLEDKFGIKVNLKIWVKVKQDWINDKKFIEENFKNQN